MSIALEEKMVSLLKELAIRLSNPETVKELVLKPGNQNPDPLVHVPRWGDLSLSSGHPGILLLFAELARQYPQEKWEEKVHVYVLAIKNAIEQEGVIIRNQSLFGGLPGICFALQCASFDGVRYQKLIKKLTPFLVKGVENYYLTPLKSYFDQGLPPSPALYDLMQGVVGIAVYTLQQVKNPIFEKLAIDIIQTIVRLTEDIVVQGKKIPGWYVLQKDLFLEEDRKEYPNGNFNLGVSHGAPGLLGVLTLAWMRNVRVKGHREGIEKIANWLLSKRSALYWGGVVGFEEEIGRVPFHPHPTRAAWCYGTPGISRMLYLAGKALDLSAWKEAAKESFLHIFEKSRDHWHIPSPTFCHGLAGLYLLTSLMAQDTRDNVLKGKEKMLKEMLLQNYQETTPFGFRDIDLTKKGELCSLDKAGLLEGAAGVLLSLLTPFLDRPRWFYPFLVAPLNELDR